MSRLSCIAAAFLLLASCHEEQTIPVEIDVLLHIENDNHTSPLTVGIENRTRSASSYRWTFEGGQPESSTQKDPGAVVFSQAGEHVITLEAWNDGDRQCKTFTVRVDSLVAAGFSAEAEVNNYAPAVFHITNLTRGGTSFKWTFEGGQPSGYVGQYPPPVTYAGKGAYRIILEVGNGSATFNSEQTVEVGETLDAAFTIIPSFEDEDDMEAPLRTTFDACLQGIESLLWECEGAVITNGTSPDATVLFPKEGDYTVYLKASNGKQEKIVSQGITVKPNTNLRTHRDIRLGVSTAQETGVFYSTKLRRKILNGELTAGIGAWIDVAYFGLNDRFIYNRFVSPALAHEVSLPAIPSARTTWFINRPEQSDLSLTPAQFGEMTTDELLKPLDIQANSDGQAFFDSGVLPRTILFETQDGRKGVILVKDMVGNGVQGSYILIDIKVQKND
jgi:PKD repeat protein